MSDNNTKVFTLAAEFLAGVADRAEPWPLLFSDWARERGLSPEQQRKVRIQIIRQRVFASTERHWGVGS